MAPEWPASHSPLRRYRSRRGRDPGAIRRFRDAGDDEWLHAESLGGPLQDDVDSGDICPFFGAIGGGTLAWWGLRFGAQELLKLVPVVGTVGGIALNATATIGFATPLSTRLRHRRSRLRLARLPEPRPNGAG